MALKDCLELLPKAVRLPSSAIVVAISYYLCAKLGLKLSFKPDYIAALWPPNSILLAALYLSKPKAWLWFLVAVVPAELAADLPAGIPLVTALGFVGADWIEVLTAAIILRKFSKDPPEFNKLKQTTIFIICCVFVAPFVAAFPGAVVTGIGENGPNYITRWSRWFLGDSLTHLLITPFILLLLSWNIKQITSRSLSYHIELLSLAAILLILSIATFSGIWLDIKTYHAMIFAPLPILLWASVRFGPHGTFSTSVFVAITSIWFGSENHGPFIGHSAAINVFNLQAFLIIAITPLLFLTSLIEEHRRSEKKLMESELKYRILFESSIDALSIIDADSGKFRDLTELKEATIKGELLIKDLKDAFAKVKALSGMLPICSVCKKVRDDKGYWKQIERYISEHSEAEFSHSICPECAKRLYPDFQL